MAGEVAAHYASAGGLSEAIAQRLRELGRDPGRLEPSELAPVDEFHIRGRDATLELAASMRLTPGSHVLDLGSGLGGPARTLAQAFGCHVSGIDLTPAFCEAATVMSEWVGLSDRVTFVEGDATHLPFDDGRFDAAMTIHVAMNIPDKAALYGEAWRVLKPGGIFAIYDVVQGEGGEVIFPVPWARLPALSHLVTPEAMEDLLQSAGFRILQVDDSTEASQAWFEAMAARMAGSGLPPLSFQTFLGPDFKGMARNQVRNLMERRIRTVTFIAQR